MHIWNSNNQRNQSSYLLKVGLLSILHSTCQQENKSNYFFCYYISFSVLRKSPPDMIREIILVDDYSDTRKYKHFFLSLIQIEMIDKVYHNPSRRTMGEDVGLCPLPRSFQKDQVYHSQYFQFSVQNLINNHLSCKITEIFMMFLKSVKCFQQDSHISTS